MPPASTIAAALRRLADGAASAARRFGYDAAEDRKRRRPPRSSGGTEDVILSTSARTRLVETARDLPRNFTTAAWAVRCHLDYVSTFNFQARTGDEKLNDALEEYVWYAGRPDAFHVAGRLDLAKALRLTEARRTLDGDAFWQRLSDGRVQPIEGDRVRTPTSGPLPADWKADDWTHGVRVSPTGRPLAYCLCRRDKRTTWQFERVLPARYVWQHAYLDRFDQLRGVSPMAPAINTFQDLYECFDYALAKAKIAQMFGLVITRDGYDAIGAVTNAEGAAADANTTKYGVDIGKGPFKLELDGDDKAEFLESDTPGSDFQAYSGLMLALGLLCLDLPVSFLDSSKCNYYGQKADIQKYENSSRDKRRDNQNLLDSWTFWRLQIAILDGDLTLPAGMTLGDVIWEWVPGALPWIDKLRDMKADALAIEKGLDNEVRAARRNGQDAYEIARERMDYEAWLIAQRKARGLPDRAAPVADDDGPEPNTGDDSDA